MVCAPGISLVTPPTWLYHPGTTDKYFYVWMDAPIGYMASFKTCAIRTAT